MPRDVRVGEIHVVFRPRDFHLGSERREQLRLEKARRELRGGDGRGKRRG